jgi:bifunctional UDP-N-acetylglucosamine pyrophosphorylase/glucosamine-1-phosphate N-acetyltransferase
MSLEVVILAAGQGTRMKSDLPKVLHQVAGRPLLGHVVEAARELAPAAIHVVIGHGAELIKRELSHFGLNWVMQAEQLGTGHAVLQALPSIADDSTVLVLYGDVPLIAHDTLETLVEHAALGPALLTARVDNPGGYGRILRDESGGVLGVVEDKDASDAQRTIDEINTGVLAAPVGDLRSYLPRVRNDNRQGEYYLPDILALAVAEGREVLSCTARSELEILGVNDRVQLNQVERELQRRQAEQLMREGVSIADAGRLDIRGNLSCAGDVSIDVNVVFEGDVTLGQGVTIGPNCVIRDATIDRGATVHAMSHVQEAVVGPNASVGPYARLRPGTVLAADARVGNFVETKKANIGAGSKVNHLSYIGDCDMGAGVNIGAGTITCNYDGVNKHPTKIGEGVFVGSNSTLVAPLEIADQGFIAAGSTITSPVKEEELAISRAKQRNIQGWSRPGKPAEKD